MENLLTSENKKNSEDIVIKKSITSKLKIAIIMGVFYERLSYYYLSRLVEEFFKAGILKSHLFIFEVPGVFEISNMLSKIEKEQLALDSILCSGIIIQGDTKNAEILLNSIFNAIFNWNLKSNLNISSGILIGNHKQEILERIDGKKSKISYLVATIIKMGISKKNKLII